MPKDEAEVLELSNKDFKWIRIKISQGSEYEHVFLFKLKTKVIGKKKDIKKNQKENLEIKNIEAPPQKKTLSGWFGQWNGVERVDIYSKTL